MKIAVISSQVFPCPPSGYSGLEMIAWHCARGLVEQGHQVALIAPDGSMCPGVTMIHSGPAGVFDERMSYGGVPNQRDGYWKHLTSFDCIIDHSWHKFSYMLKAEGVLKSPVLGVCHAPVNTMFQSPPPVEKACIVCISNDQREHYEALFAPRKARTCYNGVDTDFYKPLNMPRTNRFLFLARFSSIKGADIAIQSCLQAGVGLDLVGDTSITQEPDFYRKCVSMADGKQIRIIGGVSRGECVYWMSQAHCMLHPNQRFREPFGLAPVEAMSCGCPVVGWRYGAIPEIIASSLIVDSFEQLVDDIKTLSGPILPECRANVREQAQQFTINRMTQRYSDLCEEAVTTGGW